MQGSTKGVPILVSGALTGAADTNVPSSSSIKTYVDTADALKANIASPTFTGTVVIPTPFTLGAVPVTSTGTQINLLNAATGTTGTTTTNLVYSTSPVLITPTLGTFAATNGTFTGTVTTYNGIATANNGVLSSVGTPVNLTAQAASIAATTCYTTTADGFYQVGVTGAITTAATSSSSITTQIRWTNQADNVVKTTTAVNNVHGSNGNTTGTGFGYVITIYAKTGTAIQYITTYATSGATPMAYSLDISVVKL